MKLMKFAPALLAGLVLTACSTASDIASSTVNTVSNAANSVADGVSNAAGSVKEGISSASTGVKESVSGVVNKLNKTTKFVVYRCQDSTLVTAAYVFEGEQAKSMRLRFDKESKISHSINLTVDGKAPNPVTFASKEYRWNTAEDFSLATFDKSDSVMLTKLGKNSDQILAKGCKIDTELTSKINK